YGNPFPASYGVIGAVQASYHVLLNVTGPTKYVSGWVEVSAPVDALLHGGPLVPTMSQPQGITIAGHAATTDLTGVGTSPVIAWSARAVGTPPRSLVTIYAFEVTGRHLAASIATAGTSVTVPPGLLQAGMTYAARVMADNMTVSLTKPHHTKTTGGLAS